jgi:hypothetical protein
LKIKLNVGLLNYKAGSIIDIDKQKDKQFWYKRVFDSKRDNCVEIIKLIKIKKQKLENIKILKSKKEK